MTSKRQSYYEARKAKGLCWNCSRPLYSVALCKKCLLEMRKKSRKRGGYRSWKQSGVGRVPTELRDTKES